MAENGTALSSTAARVGAAGRGAALAVLRARLKHPGPCDGAHCRRRSSARGLAGWRGALDSLGVWLYGRRDDVCPSRRHRALQARPGKEVGVKSGHQRLSVHPSESAGR